MGHEASDVCIDCGTPRRDSRRKRCRECYLAFMQARDRSRKSYLQECNRKPPKPRETRVCDRCGGPFETFTESKLTRCRDCATVSLHGTPFDPLYDPPLGEPSRTGAGRADGCQNDNGGKIHCEQCPRMDCRIKVYMRRVAMGQEPFNPRDGVAELDLR